ncbi:MAG: cytochrome c oxidase assembly protein [Sporichthyaceae bacterium]
MSVAVTTVEPLTSVRVALTTWEWDWPMLAVALALAMLYGRGLMLLRSRQIAWPVGRAVAFGSGLGVLLLVTHSFVGAYADVLFWARATLLPAVFILVPLLLALGRPLSLAAEVLPAGVRRRAGVLLRSRGVVLAAHPLGGSLVFLVLPWVIFFSPWFEATMRYEALDVATLLLLLGFGFAYYWTRLQLDPVPRTYPQILSMFIGLGEVIANAALGLALITGAQVIASDYYAALARGWGPSIEADQKSGGGWYWIVGHVAGIPFVVLAFLLARREDRRLARRVDAELDRRHADQGDLVAPWWESDPRFAHLGRPDAHSSRDADPASTADDRHTTPPRAAGGP